MNSAEIQIALQKMQVLGSALYIAAHPDDENTSMLSWLGKEKLVRTGYLSVNRGGGGQNLIGSEKGPLMSVLRTHELLAARQIDGAEQFFTRAVDFGYSKTAGESISIWGREKILEDMVFVIRRFRPDVLLSRFSPDRGGHGHHTASAILAIEAFNAAADPSRFPEQLKYVSLWQPKRILWNTWLPRMKDFDRSELKNFIMVDVGTYNRLLGNSYSEIAAISRSMHKSQGFGFLSRRGVQPDYFSLLAGEPAQKDLFDGIPTSWNRIPGSEAVQQLLKRAIQEFDSRHPDDILPVLLQILKEIRKLPPSYWKDQKEKELLLIIQSCAGLWLEAITTIAEVTPQQKINVKATVINRCDFSFKLEKLIVPGNPVGINVNKELKNNLPVSHEFSMEIAEQEYSHPYWLKQKPGKGSYVYENHRFKGLPTAPYPFNLRLVFSINGQEIPLSVPILYRWRDPVQGERYQSLVVCPDLTLNFGEKVRYFTKPDPVNLTMILRSGPRPVSGRLRFRLPGSWKAEPQTIPYDIKEPYTKQKISILIRPPETDSSCRLVVSTGEGIEKNLHSQVKILYPHIPELFLHPIAEVRLMRVQLMRKGKSIGYIMGSGDEIPTTLRQIGYSVDILSDEDLLNRPLKNYDSIITGVRAYNTRDVLKHVQKRLLEYVAGGGRLIVQYNVSRRLKVENIGPYPFKISRRRVTEESAAVTFLAPDHSVLNFPNKISASDFSDWIQERGLYFSESWDSRYIPLISSHDTGEEAQKGGLLFCEYGKGTYVYTGYSFFRQLPAGTPGALKLFVNIIESGK